MTQRNCCSRSEISDAAFPWLPRESLQSKQLSPRNYTMANLISQRTRTRRIVAAHVHSQKTADGDFHRRSRNDSSLLLFLADSVFHGFTGLEGRNAGRVNLDLFADAGIPAHAGRAVAHFEGTKAEKSMMLFCKANGIIYSKLTDEEKFWLTRIVQKSNKATAAVSQRGKR